MTTILAVLAMATPIAQADEYKPKFPYCNTKACDQRAIARRHRRRVQARHKAIVRWRAHMRKVVAPYSYRLDRMARCESGGRWWINTGNGFYGGLQFTLRSWRAVGGVGMPNYASKLEQKYRAVKLMYIQGWGAWPVCQSA